MDSNDIEACFVPCPVCNREYEKNVIEKHVDKCIFLNTLSSNTKRGASHLEESSSQLKKVKIEKKSPVSSTSKPNNLQLQKVKIEKKSPVSSTSKARASFHVCLYYSETWLTGISRDQEIVPLKEELQRDDSEVETKKSKKPGASARSIPLAESMRPNCLEDIVGQIESFGSGSMLHTMLTMNKIPNMILWGPPGCGKTSLANVVANICKEQPSLRFVKLSATMSGIGDVKEAVKIAKNEAQFKRQTILFMDEIHRFNKLQQDTFLPHVENGTITLIGATTENPSFSLNNALLSRCRVVVLGKLSVDDVTQILQRAILRNDLAIIINSSKEEINKCDERRCRIQLESIRWLAEVCDGDARVALSALELALAAAGEDAVIGLEDLKNGIKRTHMLYDRTGEEHYNIISAMHKSIRAGDDNAALYWSTRALHGGEDPLYVARRLVRAACEDIGMADPSALVEAVACLQGCQQIGMPECDVLLAQCAVRLARADKSREIYKAMTRVQKCLKEARGPLPSVPLHLRNAPTKLMKDLGYAKGYNLSHKDVSGLTYMPEGRRRKVPPTFSKTNKS